MKEAVGRRSWDVVEKELTNLNDFSKSVQSFIDSFFLSFWFLLIHPCIRY